MKGLAVAGHNVTVLSPYKLNKPILNYRAIQIEKLEQFWVGKNLSKNTFKYKNKIIICI